MFKNGKVEIIQAIHESKLSQFGCNKLLIALNNGGILHLQIEDITDGFQDEFLCKVAEDIQSLISKRAKHRERVKEYSKTYDKNRQDKSHKRGRKG